MKFFTIILTLIFLLHSCNIYRPTDARVVSPDAKERVKKNMEEGKGLRLSGLGNRKTNFQFASSNPIWRASLDVLDFEESSFENVSSDESFEFLKNSNSVIITPHVAGWTAESKLKLSSVIVEKIVSLNLIREN